ncbi:MAG: protein-export chaperone SecB [Clostridiales bacterium]|nr:protein-export chaperone SecB [Clostridiales bacterium]MCD7827517.1 protein-export chaperone SecB [Clostridiales bacterium]
MAKANLKAFKVSKLQFTNQIKENKKIELGFSYSYNVKYAKNNTCVGQFVANIVDKSDPEEFSINATAESVFVYEEGTAKEILHVETYNEIFPYVRAFVTTITSNAGIPPIIIPFIDISKKEIYRFEMGKNDQPPTADDFVNPYDNN